MSFLKKVGLFLLGILLGIGYILLGRRSDATDNSDAVNNADSDLTNSANEVNNDIKEKEDKINELEDKINNTTVGEGWHES